MFGREGGEALFYLVQQLGELYGNISDCLHGKKV